MYLDIFSRHKINTPNTPVQGDVSELRLLFVYRAFACTGATAIGWKDDDAEKLYRATMLPDLGMPPRGCILPAQLQPSAGTAWCKVPPVVRFQPAVPFYTKISARMKPPLGGISSGNAPSPV